ncbi:MAG: methyltransferase [Shimia sp.]
MGDFGRGGWLNRLAASRRFQRLAARIPGLSQIARAEGAALFDVLAGFVSSQALAGLVELGTLEALSHGPADTATLAARAACPEDRMAILLRAVAAAGIVRLRRGTWRLTTRGAALLGVPGLVPMIRHHGAFYRDLADPAAFARGEVETELAAFWPYVFGASGAVDPEVTRIYSDLMADSQVLVAEDTLRMVDLSGAGEVLDVGGGTGAFLAALGHAHPRPRLHLFDLPAVVPGAQSRFRAAALEARATITPGSFRDDPLPRGADAITLVRVLYDHAEATVAALLSAAFAALPPGGRIVVSEPMAGHRHGDTYFALYTLAMRTGRTRTSDEIATLLRAAGFGDVRIPRAPRPFVTSVVQARKPK